MSLEQNKAVLRFYKAFDQEFRASKEMVAPNIVARGLGTGLLDGDGFSNTDS